MTPRALSLALACVLACTAAATQAQGVKPPPAAAGASAAPASPRLAAARSSTGAAARPADFIVAVVNSEPITNNEVLLRAERVLQQIKSQGGAEPGHEPLMREVLERLIQERIQVQLAQAGGIKVDDYAVQQAEASVARQNGVSVEEMHRRLAQEGVSSARFRDDLRNQMLALRVRERDVESQVRITDLDVDQYLREQQATASPDKLELNLGHIFIAVPENATAQQQGERARRAQEALAKLQAGGDFAAIAREYSDAQDAAGGGAMGLRPASRYPELFVDATRDAAVGGVVGPLRSGAGLHILKVLEQTRGGVPTTAVQTHARHILLRVGPGLTERQAAAQLEDLRRRVTQGHGDFAALAREYSQDASSKSGGDLGWALPGRYVPEFEQALAALKPGEVSAPVVSRFGVHLIELLERREARLTQREQRDMVRSEVREKKLDEAYATWMQEARARAYVEYRDPPQ